MKINHENGQNPWDAQWIWLDEDGPADTWVAFRKTVMLGDVPTDTFASIAVDSKYWLWVNGSLVVFEGGVKRGPNRTDTYFDRVDIGEYLRKGKNTIAILVWFFGKDGQFSHHNSGKGGLLFQAEIGGYRICSDSTWKAMAHPAYEKSVEGPQPNFRLPEWNVRFNAAKDIPQWITEQYDDSQWRTAVEKGVVPCTPWNALSIRPIPLWKKSEFLQYETICIAGSNAPVQLPFSSKASVTLYCRLPNSQNLQITPYIEVESEAAGLAIDIRTDFYSDGEDIGEYSIRAEYITKVGRHGAELLGWMNGQRVEYTIPAGVTVHALQFRETGYDVEFAGQFQSSDAFINKMVEKARRTLYVNMRDTYFDCPNRERAQWITDVSQSMAQAFHLFERKVDVLAKKAFDEITAWQNPQTLDIGDFAPADLKEADRFTFYLQVMQALSFGVWMYYLYSGDIDSLRRWYPHIRDYLSIWKLAEDGLVVHKTWFWDVVDNIGDKNQDMKVSENAWHFYCLNIALSMARITGNDADIGAMAAKRDSIRSNFHKLWDEELKAYKSHDVQIPDVRGNAMAVYTGLADRSQHQGIQKVLTGKGYGSVNTQKFVFEALFMMGSEEIAFKRIEEMYGAMVNDTCYSTLWEDWKQGIGRTSNHPWAGGAVTLMYQYAIGIMPETAGFDTYHVLPQEGPVNRFNVVMPSIKGNISIELCKDDGRYFLNLSSPEGTIGIVGIPRKFENITKIEVNGEIVWNNNVWIGSSNGIFWHGEDSGYYKFIVPPGTWCFVAQRNNVMLDNNIM